MWKTFKTLINNKIICKLENINSKSIQKTVFIEATNQDLKKFTVQIKELLDLELIRRPTSNRLIASMVKNYSKLVKEKAKIVINYNRINDKTRKDGYKFSNQNELINRIQGKNIN